MEQDGVHVIVDFKDLKLGHDKYEFMERIVTDETINKVLIVCNKTYKEKADKRIGGVGDESTIITPQIFGNTRQDKYIPIVNEYDESGKPYLPSYLASRMYADLVDFDKGYKELLENIREKVVGGISKETEQTNANDLDDINEFIHPTTFFDYRMQKAFPGIRGLKEFDNPKECVDRLEILLKKPLKSSQLKMQDPIWWFRGGSNLYINNFRRLSDTKFLMNSDEIEVKRIIVYADSHYFKKFIYVEAYPEKSVGIYEKVEEGFINKMVHLYGEYHEEYAVYKDNVISREEYDDGATVINGEVIDIGSDSELRVRYLSPYNFIICAKWHPLNKNEYDSIVVNILNGMLNGTKTIDELVDLVERIPRHNMDL